MKKLFITLLIVGVASSMGYALFSGEHNSSDNIVPETTQAEVLHREIAPATIPPFKGHRLQTLIDFSHELNAILFNRELTAERRAELLVAKGAPMSFDNLVAMVHDSDYAYYERCDGPCFDAIQDTIIRSYTDEILSDYWYYTEGADSVLMFDMEAFRRDYPHIFASTEMSKPNVDNANVLQELQKEVEQFIAESAILPSYDTIFSQIMQEVANTDGHILSTKATSHPDCKQKWQRSIPIKRVRPFCELGIVRMLRCNLSRCKAFCVLSTMQFPM